MAGKVKLTAKWPRRFRTYWCVVDGRGTAFLVSAQINRSKSILAFLNDSYDVSRPASGNWRWWKRIGFSCQPVDIKVRNAGRAHLVSSGKDD